MPEDSTQLLIPTCLMCMHVCVSQGSQGVFFFSCFCHSSHLFSPAWVKRQRWRERVHVRVNQTADCRLSFREDISDGSGDGGGLSKVIICQ